MTREIARATNLKRSGNDAKGYVDDQPPDYRHPYLDPIDFDEVRCYFARRNCLRTPLEWKLAKEAGRIEEAGGRKSSYRGAQATLIA